VLGAGTGSMGEAAMARLQQENDCEILIADKDPSRENETIKKLEKVPKNERASLEILDKRKIGFDISRSDDMHLIFQNFDIVVNALPVAFAPQIAEAVIMANKTSPPYRKGLTHYCDLGGSTKIDAILMKFDKEAKKNRRINRC